jgi:ABC-type spermidine/putrescine transport system, permease component I
MNRNRAYLLLVPGLAFIILCCVYPVLKIVFSTFYEGEAISLAGYGRLFTNPFFQDTLSRTLRLALLNTVLCIALGLPVAYYISRLRPGLKNLFISLATFPLLTSAVIRSFCWMIILGKRGTVNNLLLALQIIDKPLSILYTEVSMMIGYVQLFMPLMLLSLVGVMEHIDDDLILAARSMGASSPKAFVKVVLPLSVAGLIAGGLLVFTGTVTAYTTPQLLGGNRTKVLSTLLYQYTSTLGDWESASMVAAVMIVMTVFISAIMNALAKRLNKRGA